MSDENDAKTTIDEIKAFQREIQNVAERFNAEVSTQLDEWITAYKDVGMNSTVKRKIRKLLGEESTSPDDSKETKIRTQSRTEKEKTEILEAFFAEKKKGEKVLLSDIRPTIPEDWEIPKSTNLGGLFGDLLKDYATQTSAKEKLAYVWKVK